VSFWREIPLADQYLKPTGYTALRPENGPLLNFMTDLLLVVAPSGKITIGVLPVS
jgi:hypothetical protein